ncbi:MAG: hypothetical protein ACXU8N_16355 [Telluria sp.]
MNPNDHIPPRLPTREEMNARFDKVDESFKTVYACIDSKCNEVRYEFAKGMLRYTFGVMAMTVTVALAVAGFAYNEAQSVRADIHSEIQSVRGDMQGMRAEMQAVRVEMQAMRQSNEAELQAIRQSIDGLQRQLALNGAGPAQLPKK